MLICTCQDSFVSLFPMGNASSRLSCFHSISGIPTYIWRVEFKVEESAFWVLLNWHDTHHTTTLYTPTHILCRGIVDYMHFPRYLIMSFMFIVKFYYSSSSIIIKKTIRVFYEKDDFKHFTPLIIELEQSLSHS